MIRLLAAFAASLFILTWAGVFIYTRLDTQCQPPTCQFGFETFLYPALVVTTLLTTLLAGVLLAARGIRG